MAASLDNSGSSNNGTIAVPTSYVPFYWFFAAVSAVLFYYSMGYAKKYSTMAAFLLPPFICCCIAFDNVVMATTGIDRSKTSTQAMLAFHACVTPLLLLVCYEIAYVVHKQKSVNFCGIAFERSSDRRADRGGRSGRSADTRTSRRHHVRSLFVRCSVWLVSLALLVLNFVVTYKWSGQSEAEIASIYDIEGDATTHAVVSVVPALVLVALALYLGLQLWNYGTFYSYTVHGTCFNPWIWMFVGALALLVGYVLPSPLYAVTSNAGELVMMAAVVRMFREVHHDMQQDAQLRTFIDPIVAVSPLSSSLTTSDVCVHGIGLGSNSSSSNSSLSHKYELPTTARGHQHQHVHNHLSGGRLPTGTFDSDDSSYLEVVTPKDSELRLTDDDSNADRQAAAAGSNSHFGAVVVVASARTNPLCAP